MADVAFHFYAVLRFLSISTYIDER
jgi:hypothetical protein